MSAEPKKQMPKGGRKGGRVFPQLSLKDAVEYAKRLVSKTHTGSQPASIILTGVFDSGTNAGKIRASALKQYGLMDGTADAYRASDLAKNIVAAPPQESSALYQIAALKPDVFKSLYDTFKGDTVPNAKIRQQASNLEVHPDNLEKCVKMFIDSAHFAGLGHKSGDDIVLDGQLATAAAAIEVVESDDQSNEKFDTEDPKTDNRSKDTQLPTKKVAPPPASDTPASGRSVIHVNIDLDSSLDTEKLERQLALLRRYGAI
jgi:hypothetical protein